MSGVTEILADVNRSVETAEDILAKALVAYRLLHAQWAHQNPAATFAELNARLFRESVNLGLVAAEWFTANGYVQINGEWKKRDQPVAEG